MATTFAIDTDMDRAAQPLRPTNEASLGFLLNDVSRLLRRLFDQYARGLGFTRAQWRVLVHLQRNQGISQSGLADIIEVQNVTLGRLIDRMEKAGWVERRADPDDRRVRRLYLTQAAEPMLAQMHDLAARVHDQAFALLGAGERSALASSLSRVKGNLLRQLGSDGGGGPRGAAGKPTVVIGGGHAR